MVLRLIRGTNGIQQMLQYITRLGHQKEERLPGWSLSWIICSWEGQLPCCEQPYGEAHLDRF
jgi:hypothetical protein